MPIGSAGATRVQTFLRIALHSAIVIALTVCIVYSFETYRAVVRDPAYEAQVLLGYGLSNSPVKSLDRQFVDRDGDLLADAATDSTKQVDPQVLKIAYIKTTGAESIAWEELGKKIAAETGKEVEIRGFDFLSDELEAIKASNTHFLIVHAAETPYLVNHFGFIPFAIAADSHGPNGHRLQMIVPPKSPMQLVTDVKSHSLLCTEPMSIVGYRAAIAYLRQTWNLKPDFDYAVIFSGSQKESILGITGGKYEMAAVSSDKLHSMTQKGDIAPDQYRVIYSSEVIPRYAVGYFYNLKPEISAAVKQGVFAFINPPDPQDQDRPERFIATVYAKDFGTVRSIDDAFDPRLTTPTTKPADSESTSTE